MVHGFLGIYKKLVRVDRHLRSYIVLVRELDWSMEEDFGSTVSGVVAG
jgi:hypothetical protein